MFEIRLNRSVLFIALCLLSFPTFSEELPPSASEARALSNSSATANMEKRLRILYLEATKQIQEAGSFERRSAKAGIQYWSNDDIDAEFKDTMARLGYTVTGPFKKKLGPVQFFTEYKISW